MRKRLKSFTIAAFAAAFLSAPAMPALAAAAPEVGKTAPDFTGVDSNGAKIALSALRGKLVVLEWTNNGCPFVGKHYGAGNMQKTQKMARAMGAVWLSIVSSAPGTQGHVDGAGANRLTETRDAAPNHVILDPKGTIGRRYEATNTPQMFVVGKDGAVLYMGAIDSIRSANPADIPRAKNYVTAALSEIAAGRKVSEPVTRPYGCSVKYAY